MNETELKEIWKKNENLSLAGVDFERVKNRSAQLQRKLRRRIKLDIALNAAVYVLLTPLFFVTPVILLFLPVMTAVWVWYLWELRRLFNFELDFQKYASISDFLQTKRDLLEGYIRRSRRVAYFAMPFVSVYSCVLFAGFEVLKNNLSTVLIVLIVSQMLIVILEELYIRFLYRPALDEINNLLQQLE